MTKAKLDALKVGDTVTRMLAGTVAMPLKVTAIDDMIRCGHDGMEWTFHRQTGAEIDMRFGWDGITQTGSFLKFD
jgi:hypothetical protein